jgi:hypothetical protein
LATTADTSIPDNEITMSSSNSEFKGKPLQMSQQEQELEKLAKIRANRRVNSWSEQLKSPWPVVGVIIGAPALWGLVVLWASDINLGIKGLVTGLTIAVGCLVVYRGQKGWEKMKRRKFYEEELMELKHEKKG